MKKIYLTYLTFVIFVVAVSQLLSCAKVDDEPEIYCYSPVVHFIRLNWQDSEGKDLIFGNNAPYKVGDISFESDYNGQIFTAEEMYLQVDSVISDTLSVVMSYIGNGALSLGDLSPDKIAFSFENVSGEPCAASQFTKLTINDSVVCEPCTSLERVILKK
ncbi:hypothetical protein H8S90_17850 [Olivibacter sp. SDN3]|uniref:hypothetical protein n=1 Tax=Olivibacter sp. SDN3 TaxID=2764720 RepID=UPI0016512333|nr:hypothetical protein [Olivibacter sp. SDN3]QNL48636.1 hypothetical protein H8S90_17850 [Olivibacter sp. SDN3]